jgi:dTDP-4-dehydrorhamnose reductase
MDVGDLDALERLLLDKRPKVIVNCIGVIKQRTEAKSAILSIAINALLPHRLAELCTRWDGRLIHFSTDCVFSGKRGNYSEEDFADADDVYGRTKFLGEVSTNNALTLRTSIIGRELSQFKSLLEWFLSQNHRKIMGYTRAFYSGVTTNYLAELVAQIIEEQPHLSGLYQVTSATISKFDLLCLLRDAFAMDVDIDPEVKFLCDRSMNGDKFLNATGYRCPLWPELVAQLQNDPTPYGEWKKIGQQKDDDF